MENNRDKKAIDLLSDQIINAVKTICSKLEFDKTHIGIISEVKTTGLKGYVVKYNGTEIHIKTNNTGIFKKGDIVKFCIPCGNTRKAYIVVDLDLAIKLVNQLQTTENT